MGSIADLEVYEKLENGENCVDCNCQGEYRSWGSMNRDLRCKMRKQCEQKFRGGSKVCIVKAYVEEIALNVYTSWD